VITGTAAAPPLSDWRMTRRLLSTLALLALCAACAAPAPPAAPLADLVGTYEGDHGGVLEIVLGDELFAVQDEAKYMLRPDGADQVRTSFGQAIRFPRDARGRVVGYEQDGQLHRRLADTIAPLSAALARARPAGAGTDDRYRVPVDQHDGIAVGDIARSDLGPGVAQRIVRGVLDGTWRDVHGVLLYQRGHLVMEEYFYGYDGARTHQLRSATKSVVATLAGLAIDRGALPDDAVAVLPRLPYASVAHPDPRKATITLGQFLSMSSGLACNDHSDTSPGREEVIDETPDWVKATLDLPQIADPGTQATYCSGGVAVVGRTVEDAVHAALPEFAQATLFGPLGIARGDWAWNYDLSSANREYAQIHLRPRDMLKLGLLYADDGVWQGRRVLSSAWVHTALAEHSHVDNTGYGYFWWRPWMDVDTPAGPQRVQLIAAQGNGGQKIYLVPQLELVAVFTAGAYNSGTAPPNRIMQGVILPALLAARATPR